MDLVKVTYHDVTEYEEVEYEKELSELKPDTVEFRFRAATGSNQMYI